LKTLITLKVCGHCLDCLVTPTLWNTVRILVTLTLPATTLTWQLGYRTRSDLHRWTRQDTDLNVSLLAYIILDVSPFASIFFKTAPHFHVGNLYTPRSRSAAVVVFASKQKGRIWAEACHESLIWGLKLGGTGNVYFLIMIIIKTWVSNFVRATRRLHGRCPPDSSSKLLYNLLGFPKYCLPHVPAFTCMFLLKMGDEGHRP
jgi:hypothetical protein